MAIEMAHLQYMPGDPRLVDQLVYELKSKGIFDQFRKECIADVDTRPAYQNLRQRVENSVSTFLSRQCWQPDLNKNQLREKLRKHILDGNYLEQGVERIVDQVVNPKVASVFIPQVEDLVYNYLGISRKKSVPATETSNGKISTDLLPTDLEAVSPGSVKSTEDKNENNDMDTDMQDASRMEIEEPKDVKDDSVLPDEPKVEETQMSLASEHTNESVSSIDKKDIPLPTEDIKLENIPAPENSPPKAEIDKIDLHKIELPKEPNIATEIPTPDEIPLPMDRKESFFKPINLHSEDESSSDSSLRRNMSPLTPIRNYNNENSCDAQQAFDNDSDSKSNDKKEPSSFRFAIDTKSTENSLDAKTEKKDEQVNLSYQFDNQININTYNTPMFDDSSNSNNLQIDYESDVNSKIVEKVAETDPNSNDSKKDKKSEKKSSHKNSHRSRDSHRYSSSKDKRSDSKQSNSRDSSRHEKKPKDEHSSSKSKSSHREKSRDRSDRKGSRDSSKHRTSHKSSSHKESKSHRSSSSSQKYSTKHDDKKSTSSNHKDKSDKSCDKSSKDRDKDRRDSKTSSSRSDKDRKGSSSSSKSKHDDKDKKKEKKENDDHYSLSGRGNPSRRSTDRDSNDGSSSSKGFHNPSNSKASENKKKTKDSSSKSDNTSTSGESTSPSDKEHVINNANGTKNSMQPVRVENHLEVPIASPPRLPFVPDVTLKKPKFAANLQEAKKMMRMRKFLDEEQKRMNQEAALLLEFQANVRPSLSQVYSSIPGPELEFACGSSEINTHVPNQVESKHENNIIIDSEKSDINATKNTPQDNESKVQSMEIQEDKIIEPTVDLEAKLESFDTKNEISDHLESVNSEDQKGSYSENKPFSQLVEEITEYSKASERNKHTVTKTDSLHDEPKPEITQDDDTKHAEYFEVTVITEELSECEEPEIKQKQIEGVKEESENITNENTENLAKNADIENTNRVSEITHDTETTKSESPTEPEITNSNTKPNDQTSEIVKQDTQNLMQIDELHYFAEHEKYDAEIKRHQYTNFLKAYTENNLVSNKIYLFNCDTYEENIIKEASESFGSHEIINYFRNGRLKLPKTAKNVVKNVNLVTEVTLPVDNRYEKSPQHVDSYENKSPLFSPVKSECSFELSSDYDAKLEEMVNKTSRQQVMEIILGSVIDESDNPRIDYCTDSSIDSDGNNLKRKMEAESTFNNNRQVLVPKIRRLSESDQISSTTEETEQTSNKKVSVSTPNNTRSKYLGRAKRVGLSRPRRNLPNSPSSDQSVENYSQNASPAPPAAKQRYHPSDLYKPKLHYLCRRNNVS